MDLTTGRTRGAMALLLIAVITTGCAATNVARTQGPNTSTQGPSASTQGPSASTPEPVAPSAPSETVRPGPTPIIAEGLVAPPLDDLVTGGTSFDLASLRGHPTILFFGYTHCPDVCPATIGELMQVVDRRPDARVVFVTVDPERDTPEFMATWTKYMPKGFIGVTGSPTAIKAAADGYGARYARVDSASAAGYSMSHTAFQYLIDAEGRLLLQYPFGTSWETLLDTLDTVATPDQEASS